MVFLFYKGTTPMRDLRLTELRKRGPDAFQAVDLNETTHAIFTRLAIVGSGDRCADSFAHPPDTLGIQPLQKNDWSVLVNGEIYNL